MTGTVPSATVVGWADSLQALVATMNAAAGLAGASPPGTQVPRDATTLTDSTGVVWGLGAPAAGAFAVTRTLPGGAAGSGGGDGTYLEIDINGVVWAYYNVAGAYIGWWKWNGTGMTQMGTTGPVTTP